MSLSVRRLSVALREFINRPFDEEIGAGMRFEIESLLESAIETLYESPAERAESAESRGENVRIATEIIERAGG